MEREIMLVEALSMVSSPLMSMARISSCPTKGSLKNAVGCEHECGLIELHLWWAIGLQRFLFTYLW
jgi:hypothetical protein